MVRSLETKACPSTGRLIEVAFYRVRAYCGFGYWPHVIEVGCRLRCSLGASITDRSKELYTPRFSLGTSVISPLVEWKNCEIETDLGNGLYCCAMAHSDRFIKPAPRSCLIAEWTNFHPLAGRTASREVCGLGFLFPTNCHAQSSRGIVSGRCFAGAGTAILHGEELVVWRALLWCVQVSRGAWLHVWIARYVGVYVFLVSLSNVCIFSPARSPSLCPGERDRALSREMTPVLFFSVQFPWQRKDSKIGLSYKW